MIRYFVDFLHQHYHILSIKYTEKYSAQAKWHMNNINYQQLLRDWYISDSILNFAIIH